MKEGRFYPVRNELQASAVSCRYPGKLFSFYFLIISGVCSSVNFIGNAKMFLWKLTGCSIFTKKYDANERLFCTFLADSVIL